MCIIPAVCIHVRGEENFMTLVGFVASPQAESVTHRILAGGDCELAVWHPDGDDAFDDDVDAEFVELDELGEAPLIVVSAGIRQCRDLARRLGDVITGRNAIVHDIRAVEGGRPVTPSQIFNEETPTRRIGFVTGPMRLDDVRDGRAAAAVCASRFPEVHDLVEEAMKSPRFRVYHNRDLVGAELSSVFARIVSVMTGVVDALELGASLQATLFARGLAEMRRIVTAQNGDASTCYGLAGTGNLHADTLDAGDVDVQIGHFLVEESTGDEATLQDAFGTPATELIDALDAFDVVAESASIRVHLLDGLRRLVENPVDPDRIVDALMALPSFEE